MNGEGKLDLIEALFSLLPCKYCSFEVTLAKAIQSSAMCTQHCYFFTETFVIIKKVGPFTMIQSFSSSKHSHRYILANLNTP